MTGLPGRQRQKLRRPLRRLEEAGRNWSGSARFGHRCPGRAWPGRTAQMALRAAEAAGLTLGWARVVVTLEGWGGPPQCHRYLARGHLWWCPSGVSRGDCCLRCGERGHQIGRCGKKPLLGQGGGCVTAFLQQDQKKKMI